jgi:hypothetical protein
MLLPVLLLLYPRKISIEALGLAREKMGLPMLLFLLFTEHAFVYMS